MIKLKNTRNFASIIKLKFLEVYLEEEKYDQAKLFLLKTDESLFFN